MADKVPLRSVRVGRVRGRRTRTTLLIGTNFVAVPRWGAGSEQSIMNDSDCTRKNALNVALKREKKKRAGIRQRIWLPAIVAQGHTLNKQQKWPTKRDLHYNAVNSSRLNYTSPERMRLN